MKKIYKMPSQIVCELQANNMMAVSLQDGNADPNAEVLGKENTDWWYDDEGEDYNPIKDPKLF
ncbi:MAG: hypothetical protein K5899_01750 [Bacteroidaceae bacterium]|nr:hypothetical protein [Bacteroidaceae bacterium]